MRFKLGSRARRVLADKRPPLFGYSDKEELLFKFVVEYGRVSSKELTAMLCAVLRGGPLRPNDQLMTGAALRSLCHKINVNGEPFQLCCSGRKGPRPSEYWLERRRR